MTTPGGTKPTAQPPTGPRDQEDGAGTAEREAERWQNVALVLVAAAGFGGLLLDRFPQSVLLGVLALAGVGAAVHSRRLARRGGHLERPGPAQGGPGQIGQSQGGPGHGGPQPGPEGRARPDGSVPGVMPARMRPTPQQRTDRARVLVIVLGSVIAALYVLPAVFWPASTERQQCLDDALTTQAESACASGFMDDLFGSALP